METTYLTLFDEGGLVMVPLALVSLFGFLIFIERTLFLHQGQIRTNDWLSGIKNLLRKRRLVEAITVCEETPGPVPAIVKAALLAHSDGEEGMRRAIQGAAIVQVPALERRVGSLAAVARVAPLLGLLGTVLGMVQAFQALEAQGAYAHMGVLSAGFGKALVSTAFGLVIAAMAYLSHHFLYGRVRALVHDMEYAGHEMMQYLLRDLPEDDQSGSEEIRSEDSAAELSGRDETDASKVESTAQASSRNLDMSSEA